MFLALLITTAFLFLATYFDLKTGEIPDKVSIGMIIVLLVTGAVQSLLHKDLTVLNAIILGGIYFGIGYGMYRLGQWGGGDVKIFAGVGCALGLISSDALYGGISYLFDLMFVITPYAAIYAIILGFMNREVFRKFKKEIRSGDFIMIFVLSFIPIILFLIFFGKNIINLKIFALVGILFPLLTLLSRYLWVVERVALRKVVGVEELREGDVLAEDMLVDGERISKRDMDGLSKGQISKLQKLASEHKIPEQITIKLGIKFIPVFLIAFLLFLWVPTRNVLFFILGY